MYLNGVGTDNRLENLQLLCPNCHSQTANFAGRGRSRGRGRGGTEGRVAAPTAGAPRIRNLR